MMVSMKRLTDPSGRRFVSIGMGIKALMLVVVYSYRGMRIRIVSARPATPHECAYHEEGQGSKIGRHAAAHSPGRDSGCKLIGKALFWDIRDVRAKALTYQPWLPNG
jgi:Ribonuclease toxin, BrnT, of type II toxin-antitoxin system